MANFDLSFHRGTSSKLVIIPARINVWVVYAVGYQRSERIIYALGGIDYNAFYFPYIGPFSACKNQLHKIRLR